MLCSTTCIEHQDSHKLYRSPFISFSKSITSQGLPAFVLLSLCRSLAATMRRTLSTVSVLLALATAALGGPTLKTSVNAKCGAASGSTCLGSTFGNCCSKNGWCGSVSGFFFSFSLLFKGFEHAYCLVPDLNFLSADICASRTD